VIIAKTSMAHETAGPPAGKDDGLVDGDILRRRTICSSGTEIQTRNPLYYNAAPREM
jgi:hypothetical protein